jgi:hypothetical protein
MALSLKVGNATKMQTTTVSGLIGTVVQPFIANGLTMLASWSASWPGIFAGFLGFAADKSYQWQVTVLLVLLAGHLTGADPQDVLEPPEEPALAPAAAKEEKPNV